MELFTVLIVISFLSSLILSMLVIPRILIIAAKHELYDTNEDRKIHDGKVPRIGGVSFLPCILFAVLLAMGVYRKYGNNIIPMSDFPNSPEFSLFFCGLVLLYLSGIKDDLVGLSFRYKFAVQVIVSILLVFSGLYINNLYGLFGVHALTPYIGMPLTVFLCVLFINAINMIDGMDGLASGISVFALCVYSTLYLNDCQWFYAICSFSVVGVLIPFFFYNMFGNVKRGRKLFMGDAGSMTLGFIIAFLAIRYSMAPSEAHQRNDDALVMALSPVLVPLLDVVRVVIIRLKNNKPLFEPDNNHIHHVLLKLNIDKYLSLLIVISLNVGLCFMNFLLMRHLNATFIFLIDIIIWLAVMMFLDSKKLPETEDNEVSDPSPSQ